MVVAEEGGRALLCAPLLSTAVLAVAALLASGDDVAQKELLPPIAAGDAIVAVAPGDDGRWAEDAVVASASPVGDAAELSGTKRFVLDGATATTFLVAARDRHGVSLFRVDGDADGVLRRPLSTLDQTRKLADVEFTDACGQLVGVAGAGPSMLERALEIGAVALAAEAVGAAQRCLEMTTTYAKERVQFGRRIGSFQAVKHRCADMLVQVELARSAAHYAAACAGADDDDLPLAASMAKSFCTEAFFKVAAETIQGHGGIGFTWEHPAHLYFKRAKANELLLGAPREHRRRVAAGIGI
jgi:alkylation response protein AidB-like acyl-CoA dehydrogenase